MSILSELIAVEKAKREVWKQERETSDSMLMEQQRKWAAKFQALRGVLLENLEALNWTQIAAPPNFIIMKYEENDTLKFQIYKTSFGSKLAVKIWGTEHPNFLEYKLLTDLVVYDEDDPLRQEALESLFSVVMAYLRRNWLL